MTKETDIHGITDSDCLEAFDHLYSYINGELKDPKALSMIEHHLGHCKSCFTRAEMEKELNQRIKTTGQDRTPDALKNRLDKLLDDI
ncbi:MAG: zf-HC2 domain-containing protein [Gammaproteobacteria bacterium]|nr:zf-HC2 domain-containing protein [Gammaproteobacteria bacterium]